MLSSLREDAQRQKLSTKLLPMFFLKSVKTFGLIFHTFSIKIGIYLKSAHKPQSLIMEKYQNYWRKHLSRCSPISSTKIISGRNILEVGAKSKSRILITFVRHLIEGVSWLRQVLWYSCKKNVMECIVQQKELHKVWQVGGWEVRQK